MKIGKILLVLGMGLFLAIAAFNNIVMSAGGYGAVAGAVGMESTFQPPGAMWRAITSPALIWFGFVIIVGAEVIAAVICLLGARKMWAARETTESFNASKSTAIVGLSIVAAFYFIAFHAVAQEWFLMWQIQDSHVLQAAFRNFASAILIMMWINTKD